MEEINGQTSQIVHSDYEEFRKWKSRRELLRQVKKMSWAFTAAFFLQSVLLAVTGNIAGTFWSAVDSQNIFNSTLLWELANEIYAFVYYFFVIAVDCSRYLLFAKLVGFKLWEIPHNRPYTPIVLASTGFAMGVSLLGVFLSNAALSFFYIFFDKNPPEFPGPPAGSFALVLYVINSVVLPPIIEEIAYRGILLGSLRRYGDKAAIIISALLFGLAHGNMSQFPYSFVLGITIAFFVIKTNSMYTGILIHCEQWDRYFFRIFNHEYEPFNGGHDLCFKNAGRFAGISCCFVLFDMDPQSGLEASFRQLAWQYNGKTVFSYTPYVFGIMCDDMGYPDQFFMMRTDAEYMRMALRLAEKASSLGEVPVGAVAVWDGHVAGVGFNRRETGKNALAHAELEAIDAACRKLGGWRLHRCDLYVTLEPCPMCAGAIINARIRRVIFGARDPKAGCFGSVCNFTEFPFNHKPEIITGVLEEECTRILKDFFHRLREQQKKRQT